MSHTCHGGGVWEELLMCIIDEVENVREMCSSEHYFSGTGQRRPVNGCLRDPRGMSGIDRFTEMPLWRPLLELVLYSLEKAVAKVGHFFLPPFLFIFH